MKEHIRPALTLLAALSVLTGLVYPLAVTAIAQIAFPHQASGSLIDRDGRNVGSGLVGQQFEDPGYFWGRPSATPHAPYNASAGGGRNWGPLNPALAASVAQRIEALRRADPGRLGPIPVDLVTASASGLDPHISPAAAEYQVPRIARARGVAPESVRDLVARCTEPRQLGFLGEPRVNVLELNLALGTLTSASARP